MEEVNKNHGQRDEGGDNGKKRREKKMAVDINRTRGKGELVGKKPQ